jgi:hypothetical protein
VADGLARLDGPLVALVRDVPDVLAPLTARDAGVPVLLAFASEAAARAHRAALPDEVRAAVVPWTAAAGDARAKEELLRAGAAAGAVRLDLDAEPGTAPAVQLPLATALAYVESHKTGTACL